MGDLGERNQTRAATPLEGNTSPHYIGHIFSKFMTAFTSREKVGPRTAGAIFGMVLVAFAVAPLRARAGLIPMLNSSFELPQTTFAQPGADGWMTAGPAAFGAGIFLNPPSGPSGNISNAVGNQLAFISTKTGTEFSQVVAANFAPGDRYTLSVGLAKSLVSPPAVGDTLRIELYYVDGSNVRQSVALTDVTNDSATGLSNSELTYFSAQTPVIQSTDASAQKPIGILLTTIGVAGFLDMDNVTLEAALTGDANDDGAVNFQDLLILAQHYNKPGGLAEGDFNDDGAIGFDDLLILAQHYGQTDGTSAAGAASVPEPSCLPLLLAAISAFLPCRARAR